MSNLMTRAKQEWGKFRYNKGWMSQSDLMDYAQPKRTDFFSILPSDERASFVSILNDAQNMSLMSDPAYVYNAADRITNKLEGLLAKHPEFSRRFNDLNQNHPQGFMLGGDDLMGFSPTSSFIYNFFVNPMSVY